MKKIILILALFLFTLSSIEAQTYVKGYTKANGTVVQGYYRSSPNGTVKDNYSYKGNVNPYTKKIGTNKYKSDPSSAYYVKPKTNYKPAKLKIIKTPKYNTPKTSRTIYTGPRGGRYYINSNGNKTYVKRN